VTTAGRLSLFAILLVAVFAGAVLLGGVVDPSADSSDVHAEAGADAMADHTDDHAEGTRTPERTLPGVAVADGGYCLVLGRNAYARSGRAQRLAFKIVDGRAPRRTRSGSLARRYERSSRTSPGPSATTSPLFRWRPPAC
jgi:hypothetical protein